MDSPHRKCNKICCGWKVKRPYKMVDDILTIVQLRLSLEIYFSNKSENNYHKKFTIQ